MAKEENGIITFKSKNYFQKGQFVDDFEPPVMRQIQYDLSPEKMEKVSVSQSYIHRSAATL